MKLSRASENSSLSLHFAFLRHTQDGRQRTDKRTVSWIAIIRSEQKQKKSQHVLTSEFFEEKGEDSIAFY
jgi:hypothetical protein